MAFLSKTPIHLASGKPADEHDLIILRRYRLVQSLVRTRGGVLLDFGCGNGAQTFLFAEEFSLVVGVDVSMNYLRVLSSEASKRGLSDRTLPIHYDGCRLPLADASIDCIVSFEVLEHVEHEEKTLAELNRVIRPSGVLALTVPNRWWIFETHGAKLPLLPWNRIPFFSWLPKRIHDRYARARNYTRSEIIRKLQQSGLNVIESAYITAPMDVVKWRFIQKILRKTIFRGDRTRFPILSTAILVIAKRS